MYTVLAYLSKSSNLTLGFILATVTAEFIRNFDNVSSRSIAFFFKYFNFLGSTEIDIIFCFVAINELYNYLINLSIDQNGSFFNNLTSIIYSCNFI